MEVKVSVRKIRVEATSPREIKVAVGGGARCVVDDEVTELSPNPVKSSGIWAFVTGLINNLTSWISSTFSTKDELPHFSDTFTGDGSEQDPYAIPFGSEFEHSAEGVVQINKIDKSKITGLAPEPKKIIDLTTDVNTGSVIITKDDEGNDITYLKNFEIRIFGKVFSAVNSTSWRLNYPEQTIDFAQNFNTANHFYGHFCNQNVNLDVNDQPELRSYNTFKRLPNDGWEIVQKGFKGNGTGLIVGYNYITFTRSNVGDIFKITLRLDCLAGTKIEVWNLD